MSGEKRKVVAGQVQRLDQTTSNQSSEYSAWTVRRLVVNLGEDDKRRISEINKRLRGDIRISDSTSR